MNFSRSVRGPSMIVPQPGLDVYGPGIFVEQDIGMLVCHGFSIFTKA